MSVLRGDRLRPSMQPELCHLLTLHASVCNLKNIHLNFLTLKQTTNCKSRNSRVGFLTDSEEWQVVISPLRLFWFTSEPPVTWADGRTYQLRKQDETSPLPVFHKCVSSRCTVGLLTCALWTRLWRGSFPVHSPAPSTHKQHRAWPFFSHPLPNCSSPPLQPLSQSQCSVIPCLTSPDSPAQSFTPFLISYLLKS